MELGISSVGIPEISPYTKSEQPRIAGKPLTRPRSLDNYSNNIQIQKWDFQVGLPQRREGTDVAPGHWKTSSFMPVESTIYKPIQVMPLEGTYVAPDQDQNNYN